MAELAFFYFSRDSNYKVVGFTVDDEYITTSSLSGLPIIPWSQVITKYSPDHYMIHVAISYKNLNKLREEKYLQCKRAGYELASYISSKSISWDDLDVGENCFILENQNIQPRVKIQDNVMLWSGNHIGHGSKIKSHTYISSHVVISGHVSIGERCFLGVNSSIRDFAKIGDDCFIGMGAIVANDMESNSVMMPMTSKYIPGSDPLAARMISVNFGKK